MPFYEVYVPAKDASGRNVALAVEADNWLGALQTGLLNMGEDASAVSNVMCDLKDDGSIVVTDAASNRVFRLREIQAPQAQASEAAGAQPAASKRFGTAPQPLSRTESAASPGDLSRAPVVERDDVDEVIADIFERAMDLYTDRLNPDRIVNDLLDLALAKVPSDSGSFYVASISSHDLQFAAARGPKAKEIMASGLTVPMGQGIAGFCAQESVSLAVNDVQRDPRFARNISQKIGYDVHSTVVVPLDKDGRCYGAMQLINRKGGTAFSQGDLNILAAVAQQAVDLLSQVQT